VFFSIGLIADFYVLLEQDPLFAVDFPKIIIKEQKIVQIVDFVKRFVPPKKPQRIVIRGNVTIAIDVSKFVLKTLLS